MKFRPDVQHDFISKGFFALLKHRRKKVIAKMPRWPIWSSETLESKALIPNVMKPTHKKIEKVDERLRNKPLEGGNLLYITQNEKFLDDSNEKASFLYIGV